MNNNESETVWTKCLNNFSFYMSYLYHSKLTKTRYMYKKKYPYDCFVVSSIQ